MLRKACSFSGGGEEGGAGGRPWELGGGPHVDRMVTQMSSTQSTQRSRCSTGMTP